MFYQKDVSNQDTALIGQSQWMYAVSKRALDILLSATLLLVFAPLMVIIAIFIRLDSPGSVIFVQDRMGARRRIRDGQVVWELQPFRFYKFRSMYHNADQSLHRNFFEAFVQNDTERMNQLKGDNSNTLKLVHDPRITRVGKLLRKTSLDELPQLWNVFLGHMSMVGPRPSIPYEIEMYEPWHFKRLHAKPGITGLWQVTARSAADFDDTVKLDIWYVENQSFWIDIKILISTPLAVFFGKGAM